MDDCATLLSDLRPGTNYEISYVPCFPVDAILDSLQSGPVGFFKIDVEGAELAVVLGMRSCLATYRPILLCEVLATDSKAALSEASVRNARLMDCLNGLNYMVRQLIKSADGAKVIETKKIYEFPSEFYCDKNKDLCDYLFFPAEDESEVLDSLTDSDDRD
jgi:hypothetical protein